MPRCSSALSIWEALHSIKKSTGKNSPPWTVTRDAHRNRIPQTSRLGRQGRVFPEKTARLNFSNFVSCSTMLRPVWFFLFFFNYSFTKFTKLSEKEHLNFIFPSFLDCNLPSSSQAVLTFPEVKKKNLEIGIFPKIILKFFQKQCHRKKKRKSTRLQDSTIFVS